MLPVIYQCVPQYRRVLINAFYLGQILESKNMAAHLLDPLDKTTIKTTKLSSGCDWIEADWMEKSYEAKIQEIIRTKHIDSKGLLMMPLVSMGSIRVIVVGKEEKLIITMIPEFNWQNLSLMPQLLRFQTCYIWINLKAWWKNERENWLLLMKKSQV